MELLPELDKCDVYEIILEEIYYQIFLMQINWRKGHFFDVWMEVSKRVRCGQKCHWILNETDVTFLVDS